MSYEHARKLGPAIKVAVSLVFPLFVGIAASGVASAQDIPASMYSEMKWRMIGPFPAGEVNGVAAVPGNPAIYLHWRGRRRGLEHHQQRSLFRFRHICSEASGYVCGDPFCS